MYNRALYMHINVCTHICNHTGSRCTYCVQELTTGLVVTGHQW